MKNISFLNQNIQQTNDNRYDIWDYTTDENGDLIPIIIELD